MSKKSKPKDALAIEIFRPGTHVPMKGAKISFSADDVKATAEHYDPATFQAPIVIGHPQHDHPAYGWVTGLSFKGGDEDILVAYIDQVDPQFADAVENGKFKKISASFYPPQHKDNPVPDTYYLKHVGFLGAAAPAVGGLKQVEFAQDDDLITLEFGALHDVANLFSKVRDFVIDKFNLETADAVLPKYQINWIQDEATREDAKVEEADLNNFTQNEEDDMSKPNQQQLDAREASIKAREDAANARASEFAAQENETFIEANVTLGKILPVNKPKFIAFANALTTHQDSDELTVSFAAGKPIPMIEAFKELVEALPVAVEFGEAAPNEDEANVTTSFMAAADSTVNTADLADLARAEAYAKEHSVDLATAAIATQA
ncbi:MAG: hypothetical protein HRU28_05355 [Rhizobiales bacterium]|nr:hypothetical protein [Hyphomicrobiales bacterium]